MLISVTVSALQWFNFCCYKVSEKSVRIRHLEEQILMYQSALAKLEEELQSVKTKNKSLEVEMEALRTELTSVSGR